MQLYRPTLAEVQRFTRAARKAERLMRGKGGSQMNPAYAIKSIEEMIASAAALSLTGELAIRIPALPRPTLEEVKGKYPFITRVERDTSPIEAVTMSLGTVLRPDEGERISGPDYERRIAPHLELALGYQQAVWLVEHQDEFPAFMALLGKVYIDFPGIIVLYEDGRRGIACLPRLGRRWYLSWGWFDYDFGRGGRIALSRK